MLRCFLYPQLQNSLFMAFDEGTRNPKKEEQDMVLNDILHKYGTITVYSRNGGAVYPWDHGLLKHYKDRPVLHVWVNPVDVHAYVKIG